MPPFEPSYLSLLYTGELAARAAQAHQRLLSCDLCPRQCHANRRAGQLGVCLTGELARVASYGPHLGEERPLSGWRGSGTIFFNHCNLHCQYCQNYDISQTDDGELVEPAALAAIMLELQSYGCHNINLVTPTHVVPQILSALWIAAQAGLRLPLVYNSGGYEAVSTLRLLDGVIDIYMPDMKYANPALGQTCSKVSDYPQVNQSAVREMHRQVGDLLIDENGLARHGLLVRHLILPNGLAGTQEVVQFLAEKISPHTYLNLMDQYHPAYRAFQYPELSRRITQREYQSAIEMAHAAGLSRLDSFSARSIG